MLRIKLRIGGKLAISSAFGIVVLGLMVAYDQWDGVVRDRLSEQVKSAEAVHKAVLNASIEVRRFAIMVRDIRLAQRGAQVDETSKKQDMYSAAGVKALDVAIKASPDSELRNSLTKAKDVLIAYTRHIHEFAALQNELIKLRATLTEHSQSWAKAMNGALAAPELAALTNASEVARTLERADLFFASARVALFSYFVQGHADGFARVGTGMANWTKALKAAREMTQDVAAVRTIDGLAPFVPQYQDVIDKTLGIIRNQESVTKEKLDPMRAQLDKLIDETTTAIGKRTLELQVAADAQEARSNLVSWIGDALVLVSLLGAAVFAALSIARPVRRIAAVLQQLSAGNKGIEIPYADRGDEVGEAARAASAFRDNLVRIETMEAEQKESQARALAEHRAELDRLADSFDAAVGEIVGAVSSSATHLQSAATTLGKNAATTQQLAATVADESEQASGNVHSVASAAEQMASSIEEIGRQVHQSSQIAEEAVHQAEGTDARMAELSQAAQRIGDVIKLITTIAEQTNLLALNATIEAARAGDAGRGFAVVASEVKSLANQTAKATEEIGAQIVAMQNATQGSVAAIKQISGTIRRVAEIATTIASAVEEQGAATQEIARNVQQAAKNTGNVATNIADVNRGASETGSASEQVLSSAEALSREGGKLKAELDRFLVRVRAG
jgi:methyl-accepting chemotaxis protein